MNRRRKAPTCPYCGQKARIVDGTVIYPDRPNLADQKFWLCEPCDAYVGTHKRSGDPLGTLADYKTRGARRRAHAVFDPIWKSGLLSRNSAYKWLSDELGIPPERTHIGMFDQETCERTIRLCERYHQDREAEATGEGSLPDHSLESEEDIDELVAIMGSLV